MNKEDILLYQDNAFIRIFGTLRGKFLSPFRTDTRPGCYFWRSKEGRLYFVDWADYPTHRDVIKFYMDYYNIGFYQAIDLVKSGKIKNKVIQPYAVKRKEKTYTRKKLYYKERNWLDIDTKYWNRYVKDIGIVKQFIFPISEFKFKNKVLLPTIAYVVKQNTCEKIYQPKEFNQDKIFISNCKKQDIFNWEKINFFEPVYITKSFKDWVVLYEQGIKNICYVQSESMGLDDEKITQLNYLADNVYILFDNDEAGIRYANVLRDKLDINTEIILPKYKDFADWALYDKEELTNFIKNIKDGNKN